MLNQFTREDFMDINASYGRLDVTIRDSSFEAGQVSPVAIIVRNPFNIPVEIQEIQGPRSTHLREISKQETASTEEIDSGKVKKGKIFNLFTRFKSSFKHVEFSQVSIGGVTARFPKRERSLNIKAEKNSDITIENNLTHFDEVLIGAEESAKVTINPQKDEPEDLEPFGSFNIESHCEAVAYFQVSTSNWLFFTPMRKPLSTQIRYRVDGIEKTQVITSEFEIKPPLASTVMGAIFGGILGNLARALNAKSELIWQSLLVSTGSSIVMSLIAAIALSRKTGTQGFITVEDFFGGFVVGSLIGYSGSDYFEQVFLPNESSESTP